MGLESESVGGFTTAQAARLSGVSAATVRRWVSRGLLKPRREPRGLRFSWADVSRMRTWAAGGARSLVMRRLAKAADPESVQVQTRDGTVALVDDKGAFDPRSGQSWLPFEPDDAPVFQLETREDAWARASAARDEGDVGEALQLFARYLDRYPDDARAWSECGRLHHLRGDLDAAADAFRRAVLGGDLNPARAWFNLGVVYEDQGRDIEAGQAYTEAVRLEPEFADAHFNAARVWERLGDRWRALRHLHAYRHTRP